MGLVVAAAIVAFAAGIAMAIWQANRLAAPLVYLAASAEQLGSGQVRPQLEPSGVEEIDLVAAELARSADRMAGRLAAERQFASDASHQLRTPLTALTMRLEEIMLASDDPAVRVLVAAVATPLTSQDELDRRMLDKLGEVPDVRVLSPGPVDYEESYPGSTTRWQIRLVDGHQVSVGCQYREYSTERLAACDRFVATVRVG
jgi:type VII secretion-associated protein (TIGR03931 family)